MLKQKNAEYKTKIKKLEDDNFQHSKILEKLEISEAKNKLLKYENEDLKSRLLTATVEIEKLKKYYDNNPQLIEELEELPIEVNDSGSEEEEMVINLPEITTEVFKGAHKIFHCNVCPKVYLQEKRYHNHMQTHRLNATSVPISSVQRGRKCTIQYNCPEEGCNFTCPYKPAFNRHLNSHKLPTYPCPVDGCTYKSPYEKRIRNHMENKHREYNLQESNQDECQQFTLHHDDDFVEMVKHNISGDVSYIKLLIIFINF